MTIDTGNQHAPNPYFNAIGNELLVAGVPLTELASRAGRTPFYAYDHTIIDRKLNELRTAIPKEICLHYAIKANPMREVVDYLSARVDGLDVASLGELNLALATQRDPHTISFAGPGKREDELRAAIHADITINIESERELQRIASIAKEQSRKARIAIRVNPNFELKSSGMRMSGGPKPFGIDAERVPALLVSLKDLPVDLVGFHIFSGSQNLNAEAIGEAQTKSFELACELAKSTHTAIRELNIGGGLGIPYFPGEKYLNLEAIGQHLHALSERAAKELKGCKLVLELGRYLVGDAGIYVCRVIDRKESRGHLFLIVDGGMHHHLAASGNFGQVIRKNYPVVVGTKLNSTSREIADVVGPLCTPLDILAHKMELGHADIGDLIVVFQSGAYGLTASPLRFLSHAEPGELFV